MSEPKALSDTDLFAALVQVKVFTPMLAQALADHIAARAKERTALAARLAEREAEIAKNGRHTMRVTISQLKARLAEAADEVERLQRQIADNDTRGIHSCHGNCTRIACVQRREIERLRVALRQYGEHEEGCPLHPNAIGHLFDCNCGFNAALAPTDQPTVTTAEVEQ